MNATGGHQVGTYLVVGGLEGAIGKALTSVLLAEGHAVVATYSADSASKALPAAPGLSTILTTANGPEAVHEVRKQVPIGSLSGVAFCSAPFELDNEKSFDYDAFRRMIEKNVVEQIGMAMALAESLPNGSSIVFLTSTEAFSGSYAAFGYASAKAAIHNLTMSFANHFGPRQIRTNAVASGWVGGVMDTDEVFNMSRRITPLGRLGTPEEVGNVLAFLLSSKSSFVNGATIIVDGGYTSADTIAKYEAGR